MLARREFLQQIGSAAAGLFLLPAASFSRNGIPYSASRNGAPYRASLTSLPLPRSTPEAQGVPSAVISRFFDAIKASGQEFHSVMIIRHGHVIAEGWWYPYSPTVRHDLYSLSKSFTGTAIGLAADEKLLTIEDPVLSFFPNDKPATVSTNLASMKVKHLLSMSVGQEKDSILTLEATPPGERWEKTFLSLPVVYEPGLHFLYNSGASYMLSSIIRQVSGHSTHEFLGPRLYEPLGITGATWTENAEGNNMGASHLRIRTEDIARLGQLYLQEGRWGTKQILSKEWVELATKKEIENGKNDNSWAYGYGYQFWMNPTGGFRADGAYGQYSMVLPDKDIVVAITSESVDKAATMATVWDHLYPDIGEMSPLPPNAADHGQLQKELKALAFKPPFIKSRSSFAAAISGRKFILDSNPFNAKAVSFSFSGDRTTFRLMEDGKPDIVITCGMKHWITRGNKKPSAHSLFSLRRIDFDSVVAASATWKDEHSLLLSFRFIETAHGDSLTCIFDGDKLRIQFLFSAARLEKRPDDRADITGKMES
jgi:CubicO group peptidase (beta-lactamase class C family)